MFYSKHASLEIWVQFIIQYEGSFEHSNSRGTFCTLQFFLSHFSGREFFTFKNKIRCPSLLFLSLWSSKNTKLGLKLSWNTSKLWWKEERWRTLMNDYVEIVDGRMAPATNMANNKTTMLTAATERWTMSFCIVL